MLGGVAHSARGKRPERLSTIAPYKYSYLLTNNGCALPKVDTGLSSEVTTEEVVINLWESGDDLVG